MINFGAYSAPKKCHLELEDYAETNKVRFPSLILVQISQKSYFLAFMYCKFLLLQNYNLYVDTVMWIWVRSQNT